ncbi:helix-turn-helix domain-containing protein [Turicibacter sanguinis]|uniref:helix-turn-helix domain-containing protein n=1 Tax=Turicibacter sanguinis TaxID=154288 RepID=UPI002330036C|nr:helix-turn-helix transcriptional regulator [Turicibacter sanguinis]MDB8575184.1 helix-turn-helix transcriptional regulator [Turicibacter sanguinis]MDB8577275.1 helix-turn-helix transcriptional regulator [Turicibacter sanguinis]MDB8583819.1 helix-turn-helix transcriptional regulator [Turicibacter sanguinis]MDB8586603.1 helix-turn-helix transcriptional regulator [Turicibacter sanguinis]MDB8597539.1 helix-turn-helix transcriptional regulator [Turicibacter sanguinis]
MSIGSRVKEIRKEFGLNQEEFAKKINISRSNLSNIEIGRVISTDRVINDICCEFKINETWLRTGDGEKYIIQNTFSLDEYVKENNMSDIELEILKLYFSLDIETRTKAIDFFKQNILKAFTVPPKASSDTSKTSQDITIVRNNKEIEVAEEAYIKSISNFAPKTNSTVSSIIKDNNNQKQIK